MPHLRKFDSYLLCEWILRVYRVPVPPLPSRFKDAGDAWYPTRSYLPMLLPPRGSASLNATPSSEDSSVLRLSKSLQYSLRSPIIQDAGSEMPACHPTSYCPKGQGRCSTSCEASGVDWQAASLSGGPCTITFRGPPREFGLRVRGDVLRVHSSD